MPEQRLHRQENPAGELAGGVVDMEPAIGESTASSDPILLLQFVASHVAANSFPAAKRLVADHRHISAFLLDHHLELQDERSNCAPPTLERRMRLKGRDEVEEEKIEVRWRWSMEGEMKELNDLGMGGLTYIWSNYGL